MDLATVLAFALTTLLMDLTPGPAVLKVMGDAMGNGWRPAQASVIGILSANALYCMGAALGLSGLLLAFPGLFEILKWAGVSYLAWLGLREIIGAWRAPNTQIAVRPPATSRELFRSSFLVQIGNPKALLYFCAMLPTFAGMTSNPPLWIILFGAISLVAEYFVLLLYSVLGGSLAAVAQRASFRRVFDALAGAVLLVAAAMMITRTSLQSR
jgi:homoserine/homoserine lactone efflux protein